MHDRIRHGPQGSSIPRTGSMALVRSLQFQYSRSLASVAPKLYSAGFRPVIKLSQQSPALRADRSPVTHFRIYRLLRKASTAPSFMRTLLFPIIPAEHFVKPFSPISLIIFSGPVKKDPPSSFPLPPPRQYVLSSLSPAKDSRGRSGGWEKYNIYIILTHPHFFRRGVALVPIPKPCAAYPHPPRAGRGLKAPAPRAGT